MSIKRIYVDPISGGELYQCAASEVPGTPDNFTFRWQEEDFGYPIAVELKKLGIRLLVLAAKEYQPIIENGFTFVEKLALSDSSDLPELELQTALQQIIIAATRVAECTGNGGRALVTCWLGDSRASIVTATALRFLTNCSAEEARDQLREICSAPDLFDRSALAEAIHHYSPPENW